jgi:hypothetical protein
MQVALKQIGTNPTTNPTTNTTTSTTTATLLIMIILLLENSFVDALIDEYRMFNNDDSYRQQLINSYSTINI